jgi:hypothetical protein
MLDACTELEALLGCKLNLAWASKAQDEGTTSCEALLAKFLWEDVSDTLEGSLPADWGVCPCASVSQCLHASGQAIHKETLYDDNRHACWKCILFIRVDSTYVKLLPVHAH